MKKLLIFSLLADTLTLLIFFCFTSWLFSALAFGMILLGLFFLAFISEINNQKSYRVFAIPALLPTLSFLSLEVLPGSNHGLPWLYLSTVFSVFLVCSLYSSLIKNNYYYKELKYEQRVTQRKVAAICLLNGFILSLGELLIIYHFE